MKNLSLDKVLNEYVEKCQSGTIIHLEVILSILAIIDVYYNLLRIH